MIEKPIDVVRLYPVRKTKKQKQDFCDDVQNYIRELGYECIIEKGSKEVHNIVFGNPDHARYLVTAHYDTASSLGIPNICTPCNLFLWGLPYLAGLAIGVCFGTAAVMLIRSGYTHVAIGLFVVLFAILVLLHIAPANKSNVNDNTSGVITALEIARTLPEAHRNKVCFILFDLEEKGLKGSAAYRKAHKADTEKQIVLNLDCVGDGDHILLMPTKKARKDGNLIRKLKFLGGWFGKKQILTIDKGFCVYNSDHKNFPLAVGIGAFHKKKGRGFVLDKIHTKHDTNLEITNVNLLRAALTTLICGDAVK